MILTANIKVASPVVHTTGSATYAVPYPPGCRRDDVLVTIVGLVSANLISSLGAPWVDDCRHAGTGDTLIPSLYVAHKPYAGETGTLTVNTPSTVGQGIMVAVPDADLLSFLDVAASVMFKDQTSATNTNVTPAGTLTRPWSLLLGTAIDNSGGPHTWTQPTNWTEINDGVASTSSLDVAYLLRSQALSTGTITWTIDSAQVGKSLSQVLAVRPASPRDGLLLAT